MRIQFGTLLADIGFINLPKNYQVYFPWFNWFDFYAIWCGLYFVLLVLQIRGKKENLDGWFSDYSQPFNMNSHHYPVVKVIMNITFACFLFICFWVSWHFSQLLQFCISLMLWQILFWSLFTSFIWMICCPFRTLWTISFWTISLS